jgi:hypothetical protein
MKLKRKRKPLIKAFAKNTKKEFIENSAFFLNHYRTRLKEYQDYVSKL